MAQELIRTADGEAARLRARVRSLYATIERDAHYRDALPAAINLAERKALESYRRDLHARLRGIGDAMAERETARAGISMFLGGYANVRADAKSISQAYVAVMLEQPLFAILAALDDFRHGRVYDLNAEGERVPFTLDHAPSAPRILDQVKKHTDPIVDERGRVVRLLAINKIAAPEVSDAERERVAVHMRELADALAMKNARLRAVEREKIGAEAQEARDRAARIKENAARQRASGEAPSLHDDDFYVDAPKADFAPIEHPS